MASSQGDMEGNVGKRASGCNPVACAHAIPATQTFFIRLIYLNREAFELNRGFLSRALPPEPKLPRHRPEKRPQISAPHFTLRA
ncbi:hypothetical protein [Beijerinckia mobilis]|uniref:hypothetical protein n=1 Tax=Beijerinckia mobilis TaxID=231434 RepID=UPI0012EB1442|nr:hypothetical protein [Beijerinckia mobilis]